MSATAAAAEGLTEGTAGLGAPIDAKAHRAFIQRYAEIKPELDLAERDHDLGRKEALQNEQEMLSKLLLSQAHWAARTEQLELKRASDSVRFAVKVAIAEVRKVHPELADHLARSVSFGYTPMYWPR